MSMKHVLKASVPLFVLALSAGAMSACGDNNSDTASTEATVEEAPTTTEATVEEAPTTTEATVEEAPTTTTTVPTGAMTPEGAVFELERVERTSEFPADLVGRGGDAPILAEGNEFLVVEVTVTERGSAHLAPYDLAPGARDENVLLPADAGFAFVASVISGVEFFDLTDITSSVELADGASLTLVFEIPIGAVPDAVRIAYVHFDEWSPTGERVGEEGRSVDVPLT